jgi:IS30 family transposase
MMSPVQRQRIEELRRKGMGYGAIAKHMKMPLNTIKSFCRRNNLASDVIPMPRKQRCKPRKKKEVPKISLEITVSYNEKPSAVAVADVMQTLMHIQGR